MGYKNTRPDSPKGQIYTQWAEHGEERALNFGMSIGVEVTRIRRWFKQWGETTPPRPSAPLTNTGPTSDNASSAPTTDRVRLKGGGFKGRIVNRGRDQSEVRWDHGTQQVVSNSWIEPDERTERVRPRKA